MTTLALMVVTVPVVRPVVRPTFCTGRLGAATGGGLGLPENDGSLALLESSIRSSRSGPCGVSGGGSPP
jgi:hypothetical protein